MLSYLSKIFRYIYNYSNIKRDSASYIKFLKKKGVKIGKNIHFHQLEGVNIDVTRPELLEIGNNVRFTQGLTIITHDFSWFVTLNKYKNMVAKSGSVKIGSNVFIGYNVSIMPDTNIGDNVIIGTRSLVQGKIESDSVYAGTPAKKIMDLDSFFAKRKILRDKEIEEYITILFEKYGYNIKDEMLSEEFYGIHPDAFDKKILKRQLKDHYEDYLKKSDFKYSSKKSLIDDFKK